MRQLSQLFLQIKPLESRIPLTMIGIMQCIAPTLQYLIGVLLYKKSSPPPV
jgi:EamA domain-containing membrane protein RarD